MTKNLQTPAKKIHKRKKGQGTRICKDLYLEVVTDFSTDIACPALIKVTVQHESFWLKRLFPRYILPIFLAIALLFRKK